MKVELAGRAEIAKSVAEPPHSKIALGRRASGGGEFQVGVGDYAGLKRWPARVGGGIATEAN